KKNLTVVKVVLTEKAKKELHSCPFSGLLHVIGFWATFARGRTTARPIFNNLMQCTTGQCVLLRRIITRRLQCVMLRIVLMARKPELCKATQFCANTQLCIRLPGSI